MIHCVHFMVLVWNRTYDVSKVRPNALQYVMMHDKLEVVTTDGETRDEQIKTGVMFAIVKRSLFH